jgi:hypothetical protein
LKKRFAEKHLMGCSAKNGSEIKIVARGCFGKVVCVCYKATPMLQNNNN